MVGVGRGGSTHFCGRGARLVHLDAALGEIVRGAGERAHLARDVPEQATELLVALGEVLLAVFETVLLGPPLREHGRRAEVRAREAREHLWAREGSVEVNGERGKATNVVHDLHVKTTVHKVEVLGARDVHRRAELAMDEALVDTHVGRVLRAVREHNLVRVKSVPVRCVREVRRAHLDVDRADGEQHEERVRDAGDPAVEAGAHVLHEERVPGPEERDADELERLKAPVVRLGLGEELRGTCSASRAL